MVRVAANHITDTSVLVKMAPERVTGIDVAKVTKGDPGTTKDVVMKTINCWQSEISVGWIDLKTIHDCCNTDTVPPYVSWKVKGTK